MEDKQTVFCNSGHFSEDQGTSAHGQKESELAMLVRDRLKSRFPEHFYVPDNLNLRKSIDWVNDNAKSTDLAYSIHMNHHSNIYVRGVEVYYDTDYEIAQDFARTISEVTGLPNRGARHQSESNLGKLGWLDQLRCPSILIEVCYLSNAKDRNFISFPSGREKVADGIEKALKLHGIRRQISFIQRIIEALKQRVERLLK